MAEALHQAVGLEKLPEVNSLLNRDTIFIEVQGYKDSVYNEVLAGLLPTHVDLWRVKSISQKEIKLRDDDFHYLKLFLEKEDNKFIIDIICQPNYENFIDRGFIRLVYKFKDGVFILISLSKGYS